MLISALKTLAPSRFPVVIDGYHYPADGGEGIFRHHYTLPDWATWIDFDAPGPHEDGGIVVQSVHDGYWIRRYTEAVSIKWFGAAGDGVADDTNPVIKACIVAQNLYGDYATVYFPAGHYKGRFTASDVHITGDGKKTILTAINNAGEVIHTAGSHLSLSNIIIAGNTGTVGLCVKTPAQQFDLSIENIQFIDCPKDIVQDQDNDCMTWIDYNIKDTTGINIHHSNISSIKLSASTATLHHCLQDAMENGYHRNDVDEASTLEACDHYYNYTVGDNLFVHSIGYDGSFDIHQVAIPTSVRGQLRDKLTTVPGILISEHFDQDKPYGFEADATTPGSQSINAIQVNDGVLKSKCIEVSIALYHVVKSTLCFSAVQGTGKYYAWSVHAYSCDSGIDNSVSATIRNNLGDSLGHVIFKKGEWTCSYGVKQMDLTPCTTEDNDVHLYIDGGEHGGSIRLCDFQVVAFDTLKQATEFANSGVFAVNI